MRPSQTKCPRCADALHVSNAGDFWCGTCRKWIDATQADPAGRDPVRMAVVKSYEVEKARYRAEDGE